MSADAALITALGAMTKFDPSGPLGTAIQDHPVLGAAIGKHARHIMGWQQIQLYTIAQKLWDMKRSGTSPADAVAAVVSYVHDAESDVLTIQCVHGISVDSELVLSPELSIVRGDDLPPSHLRDQLFVFEGGVLKGGVDMVFPRPRAAAAIVYRSKISPTIGSDADFHANDIIDKRETASAQIAMAFAALVAAGAKAELGFQFSHMMHAGNLSGESGVLWSSFSQAFGVNEGFDKDDVVQRFAELQKFEQPLELIRLIARLARARRQVDPVDAHLDFGIVAESLLTHNEAEHGEIGHRLSIRAAWLLGASPATRRDYWKRMKRLYDLRSAAAHRGRLPQTKQAWTVEDKQHCDALCTALVRTTLAHGAFVSEWQAVVFGEA